MKEELEVFLLLFDEDFLKEALFLLNLFLEGAALFFESCFFGFFSIMEASSVLEEVTIMLLISFISSSDNSRQSPDCSDERGKGLDC